jgi:hypothetical protein
MCLYVKCVSCVAGTCCNITTGGLQPAGPFGHIEYTLHLLSTAANNARVCACVCTRVCFLRTRGVCVPRCERAFDALHVCICAGMAYVWLGVYKRDMSHTFLDQFGRN